MSSSSAAMQGGSSGIGYGLKYQVNTPNPYPNLKFVNPNFDCNRLILSVASRLDVYQMLKLTQIILALSPALLVSKKKMRFIFFHNTLNEFGVSSLDLDLM